MAQALHPMKCAATVTYNENITLRYIEEHRPLIQDHITMYNQLRQFVDDVLCQKIPWKLSKLPPKLLQIVDHNDKHHDQVYAAPDMYHYLQKYATSQTLLACCIGSNYVIDIAKQCILDIVQWRVCSKIDTITPHAFKNSLQTHTVLNMGEFDKHGHPICHFQVLETPPDDPWTIVRAAVFTMEKCIKLAETKNRYQMLWLLDLEHLAYSTMPPVEILREISNLMTYYYPERLYKSYLVFTPWVFSAIFAMIKPILPARTQGKMMNPSWYESSEYDTFKHEVEKTQLMKRFGGDSDAKYDYEWEVNQYNKLNPKTKEAAIEDEKECDDDDDDDDSKLCIVCLDGERNHVLIPCGHICVCNQCKDEYLKDAECPLCRTKVKMVVKTFT
eukprot:145203_1